MARRWGVLALSAWLAASTLAQQQKPEEPPEEDETLAPKEYTFNPLQAEKEVRVGKFYFKKGSYRAAAGRFREATLWNSGLAEAYLLLGEAREKLKDYKAARDAYTKYADLETDARKAKEIRERISRLPADKRD
jgi:tetratricopeptide (TPR) repeat protein